MNKSYLELKNIKKIYPNGFQAIFNLDLKIEKGEFIVFVGPSGCGKSTTIRMISGLENTSSGQIILNGRDATDLPARKRNISMVFQNYALFPHLTVKENISFTLKTKRVPREIIEQKVQWAADVLQLSYLLNRKPAQLSGGQRQRVALGRAIVAEPKLFLMDEPLSNLDAKLRGVMRTTIRKLHNDLKTTSIYVTHDQIEAMTMADKIVVMSDGFVQQIGTPQEVFENPANIFVASFIGSPSINLIEGEFKTGNFISESGEIKIKRKLIRKSSSKNIKLGFRPQYAIISKTKKQNAFKLQVDFVEMLGAEAIVYFENSWKVVVSSNNRPSKGDVVYVQPTPEKVMLFDSVKGISITNTINKATMDSLNIFYQSENLIKQRVSLMEKQRNKKAGSTLYQKSSNKILKNIFPQFMLLHPLLSSKKEDLRAAKKDLKNNQRMKNKSKILASNKNIKKLTFEIKKLSTELRSHQKDITQFEKLSANIKKLNNSMKVIKNSNLAHEKNKYKKQIEISDNIKKNFNMNSEYDYEKIKMFNEVTLKLLRNKHKG